MEQQKLLFSDRKSSDLLLVFATPKFHYTLNFTSLKMQCFCLTSSCSLFCMHSVFLLPHDSLNITDLLSTNILLTHITNHKYITRRLTEEQHIPFTDLPTKFFYLSLLCFRYGYIFISWIMTPSLFLSINTFIMLDREYSWRNVSDKLFYNRALKSINYGILYNCNTYVL